jgi:sodium-dependent dicarboxylate transporter 2/3/5
VLAAASAELVGVEISFVEWMAVGLPVTIVFLPIAWGMLLYMYPPEELGGNASGILASERASLGPMGRGERIVAVIFFLTAISWVFRAPLDLGFISLPGLATLFPGIRDSTIAMGAAVALFLIPVYPSNGVQAITWRDTESVPWGVLLLFGGGLALALAMDRSGLAGWIGEGVVGLGGVSLLVLVAAVATLFIFLTEITSNTATSTMAMPLMVGVAAALGTDAVTLMATAAMASSMAFMLPVATPPNAIVFGAERMTIQQMARAGFFMNLISIVIVTVFVFTIVPRVFGD